MTVVHCDRPITVVVPHGAGGSTDTAVRALFQSAAAYLSVPVRVENLTGLNGACALDEMVARIIAAPDGYTLSTANSSVILSPIVGETKFRYMDRIRPLCMYAQAPFLLACRADLPFHTLAELVAGGARRLRAGNSGVGNVSHVVMELFRAQSGLQVDTVSFESGKLLADAFTRGDIDMLISNAVDLRGAIAKGEARVLAVASDASVSLAPTFREQGYDIVAMLRQGIGISPEAAEDWYRPLHEVLRVSACDARVISRIESYGMRSMYLPGDEYRLLWADEDARWRAQLSGELGERVRAAVADARKKEGVIL